MSRPRQILLIGSALVIVLLVALILAAPAIQRSVFYPKPTGLPSVVTQTTEQLLARLQALLETNAPAVANSLQPGLPDAEISRLEAKGGFRLSEDLRALYRWHNGMSTNGMAELLPVHRFLPLEEVVAEHALMQRQSGLAFKVFAGHRKGWLHILDDGAGDGYFYDPRRRDAEGAFFFHFAEVADYIWFPSLRNFLAGVIECYETDAVKVGTNGKSLEDDFERTEKIWNRLGKSRYSSGLDE